MSVDTMTAAPSATATVRIETTLGHLLPALKAAGVGMATRPAVPVLSFVRLETEGHVTTASCFDYATSGSSEFVSDVPSYGSILLPYKQLVDLLTAAGKGTTKRVRESWTVTITGGESSHTVTVNGTTYNLMAGPVNEYPELPNVDAGEATDEIVVDTARLIRLMDSVSVAASKDDNLPMLTGVKLQTWGNELEAFTTDRYRLMHATMPAFGVSELSALVPVKAWKKIKKHLNVNIQTVVRFHKSANHHPQMVSFHNESVSTTYEVEGDYPKILSLFPDKHNHEFTFDADRMTAAVTALLPVIERNTPVRLTYGMDGVITLDGGTGEDAQAQATVPFTSRDGLESNFVVAFNPHYLLEGLKIFKGESATFAHTISPKPAVLTTSGDESMRYLLMPVRLPGQ